MQSKEYPKLRNCPFCGRKPSKVREHYIAGLGEIYYTVECHQRGSKCSVNPRTTFFKTKEEAVEAWNRRAENEELRFTRQFIVDRGLLYELLNEWEARADND